MQQNIYYFWKMKDQKECMNLFVIVLYNKELNA